MTVAARAAQVLLGSLALALGIAVRAQPAPSLDAPQARVAYDMHSARINQIRATSDLQRLVTTSEDKTLRVWRLSDLALLRTIHVPSAPGAEGALRALATLGTQEVLVGGWTGRDFGRGASLYRFDVAAGRLLRRYAGFDASIESLAATKDGRFVAVGLAGRQGLRMIDAETGAALWQDRAYNERVGFVDVSADGRVATTSADGCVRLYSSQGQLVFRSDFPPLPVARERACTGSELGGIRFSPDGRWLAVGMIDRALVGILDGRTGALQRLITVDDQRQGSLCCIAWAADGTLYFNGAHDDETETPVYRASMPEGAPQRAATGRQRITNMLPLPDGALVFATSEPGLVRVDRAGTPRAVHRPPNPDFMRPTAAFRIDATATRIALADDGAAGPGWLLSVTEEADRVLRRVTPVDLASMAAAERSGGQVTAVLDAVGYRQPALAMGHRLALQPFQAVRSWAGRGDLVVVGTQWSVARVGERGALRWEQQLPAPAYHVALSEDGALVVAAVGDGTLRWYDAADGRERLAAFVHANGRDWIVWRPDGFYASSPGGDEYLGWLVNRGDDVEPDFLRAVQFERSLYRPDLVRAALQRDATRGASPGAPAAALGPNSAPRVRILAIDEKSRSVHFSVQATGAPVRRVGVYADGVPLLRMAERAPGDVGSSTERTVTVPAGLPLDRIRVEAETDQALGIDEAAALVPAPAARTRARLWLLAIGVEKFPDFAGCGTARNCSVRVPELPNAPVDARVIAGALRERAAGLYREVHATVLAHRFGAVPTKAAIVAALKELEQAGPEDTVLVFVGSHGFAGGAGAAPEYYFLPADARESSLARLFAQARGQAPPPGSSMDSLLSASELTDALRRVPGRRILAIDTCHAGAAGVSSNPYSIAKRSASSQFAVLSASTGDELSYEYIDPKVPHGGFTHALINGLRGAADGDRDGRTTLDELFAYIGPEVRRNVDALNAEERRQNPKHRDLTQTPVLYASPVLRASVLAGAR